ncbi:hypothetical protein PO883_05925 [Massilia sp. DJPM01]|uniref:hypothetical protein n=1 Tax=Massilia sp. DJPM01 TaxID=3024404 RepID=UPI00259E3F3C|nr:hypothetical protein [Massilia sp. DJPM01]MDM5176732.1 hypothetical protein [Massilia sp. DJPM01]
MLRLEEKPRIREAGGFPAAFPVFSGGESKLSPAANLSGQWIFGDTLVPLNRGEVVAPGAYTSFTWSFSWIRLRRWLPQR